MAKVAPATAAELVKGRKWNLIRKLASKVTHLEATLRPIPTHVSTQCGLCDYLCVGYNRELCKAAEPIEKSFEGQRGGLVWWREGARSRVVRA